MIKNNVTFPEYKRNKSFKPYDLDKIHIANSFEFKQYALANFFEVSIFTIKITWKSKYNIRDAEIERLYEIFSCDDYYKYRDEFYSIIGSENVADAIWSKLFFDDPETDDTTISK